MANPPGTRLDIVVCQQHGLRYNRAVDTGCAMCRREGTTAEPPRPPASAGAVRTQAPAPPPPRPALAVPPSPPSTAPHGPAPRVAAPTPPRATLQVPPAPPRPPAPTPTPPVAAPAAEVLPSLLPDLPPQPEALTATGSRRMDVAVCEKHGLRYNRAVESGCVRCRRDTGATTATTTSTAAGRLGTAVRLDAPSSMGVQLLIAALLVGGTGGLCRMAHQAVLESFAGGLLVQTGSAGMDVVDDPGEAYGDDAPDTSDAAEPASWPPPRPTGPQPTAPPGMKGRGPVEQQKQIEELFRQMQEDEAKEREGQGPPPSDSPQ